MIENSVDLVQIKKDLELIQKSADEIQNILKSLSRLEDIELEKYCGNVEMIKIDS